MNLQTFFNEKALDAQTYEIETALRLHLISSETVIEGILRTKGEERQKIAAILGQIDRANGDLHHFLRHLAQAIANQYDAE